MADIYQQVTDRIVAMIEEGAGEWRMPWHRSGGCVAMPESVAGRAYRGINVPLLWAAAEQKGYSSPVWGTYKAWQEKGAQVRKGEKSTLIIFWKSYHAEDEDGEDVTRLVARGYAVFNAEQVDGYQPVAKPESPEGERIAVVDAFFRAVGATVRHGGDRAFYAPSADYIGMPQFQQFEGAEAYYSTLAHEHVHWTGAKARCDREFGRRFGDEAYAVEELVAELGSAFLCCSALGISNEPRKDHAAYLASWLRVLKTDKRAIFTAASKAQAAADYLIAASAADALSVAA